LASWRDMAKSLRAALRPKDQIGLSEAGVFYPYL